MRGRFLFGIFLLAFLSASLDSQASYSQIYFLERGRGVSPRSPHPTALSRGGDFFSSPRSPLGASVLPEPFHQGVSRSVLRAPGVGLGLQSRLRISLRAQESSSSLFNSVESPLMAQALPDDLGSEPASDLVPVRQGQRKKRDPLKLRRKWKGLNTFWRTLLGWNSLSQGSQDESSSDEESEDESDSDDESKSEGSVHPSTSKEPTQQSAESQEPLPLPQAWYAIALSSEVGETPVALRRFNVNLVLWRAEEGRLVVMEDSCPHQPQVRLSQGSVRVADAGKPACIRCSAHSLCFNAEGELQPQSESDSSRILPPVKTFQVIERNRLIWMKWGEQDESTPVNLDHLEGYQTIWAKIHSAVGFQQNLEVQLALLPTFVAYEPAALQGEFSEIGAPKADPLQDRVNFVLQKDRSRLEFQDFPFGSGLIFPNLWSYSLKDLYEVTVIYAPVSSNQTEIYIGSHRKTEPSQAQSDLSESLRILQPWHDFIFENQKRDLDLSASNPLIDHFRKWLGGEL